MLKQSKVIGSFWLLCDEREPIQLDALRVDKEVTKLAARFTRPLLTRILMFTDYEVLTTDKCILS